MVIKKSPWLLIWSSGGCNGCIIEILALKTPRYDIERFGSLVKGSPRHVDVFIISGPVTKKALSRLKRLYDQTPHPKKVIAIGSCACSGGIFKKCYGCVGGVEKAIPVDVFLPGCPPKPEAIIDTLLKALSNSR